ncbi:MAG: sensor histidine kinase [Solirubrobacteraceae bacterium]
MIEAPDLRPVDLFDELDDEQLEQWAAASTERHLAEGELLVDVGDEHAGVTFLLEGTMEALVVEDGRVAPAGEHRAPTWMGAIAALTAGPMGVRMRALTACRCATVPAEAFVELAMAHRPVFQRAMRQVRPVMGRITAIEQNRERLASLGTMSAGLAHELNNPAAAAKRAAAELAEALDVLGNSIGRFVESGIERTEAAQLVAMQRAAVEAAQDDAELSALDAADAEDELLAALEEHGVPEPWRYTEPLVAARVDRAWLDRAHELAGPALPGVVRWVAATLTARELAAQLAESTDRMSELVGAVKAYAYMDRGGLVEVDVHEGLKTTLMVLGHKLKHTHIEVAKDFDRTLPKLTVRGSELNQVWTNLLDNAIDALGDQGTLTLRTRRDGDCVVVEIADDGPGIPPEVRERIFDPFFTTKEVGRGTGLGLGTARRIVEDRHRGSLTVDSAPGATTFRVWLPIEQTARRA